MYEHLLIVNTDEGELIKGTIEKSFSDLGKAMHTFGKSVQKTLEDKEEE